MTPEKSADLANPPRRIAIIGGGVTGLTAAYDLTRAAAAPGGVPGPSAKPQVTVYEHGAQLGGLAGGFKGRESWEWPLEHFYHHLFLSDKAMLGLLDEIGFRQALKTYRPNTAIHTQGSNYPLDSVTRVLRFPLIPFIDRLRMGMVIGYLRFHPGRPWREFDKLRADAWLKHWMGPRAYAAAWEFQLQGKFGEYYREVNLAWFWARVYARTTQLAYFDGGFQAFTDHLARRVREQGVEIHTGAAVEAVRPLGGGRLTVEVAGQAPEEFDQVLSTVGPGLMARLAPDLPPDYLGRLHNLKSMGAVVLTVALDRKLTEDMYWISMPKPEGIPFLALVEHTNMIDPAPLWRRPPALSRRLPATRAPLFRPQRRAAAGRVRAAPGQVQPAVQPFLGHRRLGAQGQVRPARPAGGLRRHDPRHAHPAARAVFCLDEPGVSVGSGDELCGGVGETGCGGDDGRLRGTTLP